jgi:hypothetical protein
LLLIASALKRAPFFAACRSLILTLPSAKTCLPNDVTEVKGDLGIEPNLAGEWPVPPIRQECDHTETAHVTLTAVPGWLATATATPYSLPCASNSRSSL